MNSSEKLHNFVAVATAASGSAPQLPPPLVLRHFDFPSHGSPRCCRNRANARSSFCLLFFAVGLLISIIFRALVRRRRNALSLIDCIRQRTASCFPDRRAKIIESLRTASEPTRACVSVIIAHEIEAVRMDYASIDCAKIELKTWKPTSDGSELAKPESWCTPSCKYALFVHDLYEP